MPRFTSKDHAKLLVDLLGTWLSVPKPTPQPMLTCDDASIVFRHNLTGRGTMVLQIQKSIANDSYFSIPISLGCPLAEDVVDELRVIMATTYAGQDLGRDVELSLEALCAMSKPIPPVQVMQIGIGGNSKSARTVLRNNVLHGHHVTLSPTTFQVPEEFRKQGGQVAHARMITVQECRPGEPLIEDEWKSGYQVNASRADRCSAKRPSILLGTVLARSGR